MMAYLIFFLLVFSILAVGYFLFRYLMRRDINYVIKTFRANDAVGPDKARSKMELGLSGVADSTMTERLFKVRDYKPYVFDTLVQLDIVKVTEDNKFYLSEPDLQNSKLSDHIKEGSFS